MIDKAAIDKLRDLEFYQNELIDHSVLIDPDMAELLERHLPELLDTAERVKKNEEGGTNAD